MRLIRILISIASLGLLGGTPLVAGAADDERLAEITVSGYRHAGSRLDYPGNIARITADSIRWTGHHHVGELLDRVAGAWIVRGSGQDHQTALRSPVLGGPGSCGGFLILEDGVPTRPAGFCNTNQLVEVNAEQARAVEVVRGPANALFGSNALHGIINVLMPDPRDPGGASAAIEYGANDYRRVRATLPFTEDAGWLAALNVSEDGGFRDDSGYRQGKLHVKGSWPRNTGDLSVAATITDLQQQTAGFIVGYKAYEDRNLARTNPNPEAFRDVSSARISTSWTSMWGRLDIDVRSFMRYSSMRFLHHSLPGQPVERNGQVSGGILTAATYETESAKLVFGLDVDYSDVFLQQIQDGPASGPPMQSETRPEGKHYDYDVGAWVMAGFSQLDYALDDRWVVSGGLRVEHARYDYDNRMIAGNTRDDGSVCGFGGCLYTRPEDRKDRFTSVSPNVALRYRVAEPQTVYLSLTSGFRTPQSLELYRLQNGQQVADLDPEYVRSAELGFRHLGRRMAADVVAYYLQKRNSTFRDAEGFNVSGASTNHQGVEVDVDLQLDRHWLLGANLSYAIHKYDFDAPGRGESFVSGRDVKSAPRWLGGMELRYRSDDGWQAGARIQHVGEYFLDPANDHRYSGHTIVSLRAALTLNRNLSLAMKLNNLLDERYADRAEFAARNYRYLPGRGREFFVELRYSPEASMGYSHAHQVR